MNKNFVLCGILLLFTLQLVSLTSIYAGETDGSMVPPRPPFPPPKALSRPMAPPPPLMPCPPNPPGVEMEITCMTPTLDDLRTKYLDTEGISNRALNFYYYFGAFFRKHRLYKTTVKNQVNYSVDTRIMLETLGPPDYFKTKMKINGVMDVYAYVFTSKSHGDSVMLVYTANGLIYKTGYSQTSRIIEDSWEKLK